MSTWVRRILVEGWASPSAVRERLFGNRDLQVWLDAGLAARTGRSYLGACRTRLVTADVDRGTVTERFVANGRERELHCTVFDYLRDDLGNHVDITARVSDSALDDRNALEHTDASFRLGWVGWFGYELGRQTVGAPVAQADPGIPDACLVFLDRAVEFDHDTRTVWALSFEGDDAWPAEVAGAVSEVVARLEPAREAASEMPVPSRIHLRWNHEHYESLIKKCLEQIRAGNAYQLCLTNRIDVEFASVVNPFGLYEQLRTANPTHHGGMLAFGATSLLSSSPEVFLNVTPDGHVTTKPIKGTRPRGASTDVDAQLATELSENEKERAENLMIVDLMRNDLGRIAQVGTVTVEKMLDVESYANVHQLVSTVGADLAVGLTAVDALEACFPAGSMTGAPKLSAMRILNGFEAGPRGIYSGAYGYLSLDGACDLAMVIRSIVLQESSGNGMRASIGTGGGITSGSIPSEEWEETLVKARPLLRVLGVADAPF